VAGYCVRAEGILKHSTSGGRDSARARFPIEAQFAFCGCAKIYPRPRMEIEPQILETFGKRIQRCYGCFIAYHLKDMYLGEDVTFFCEHCKDESMFHFDDFSRLMDISKLKEVAEHDHHH
jgi:hypothetical protein